jgi:hypothetical protein
MGQTATRTGIADLVPDFQFVPGSYPAELRNDA